MSIVVDLLIMACFIAHEVMGWPARAPQPAEAPEANPEPAPPQPVTAIVEQSNVVALIQPPQRTGPVEKFLLACVGPAKGSTVSWAELYVRYSRWCSDEGFTAMTAEAFGKRLDRLRVEGIVRARAKGEDVFCLDVKLVA